MSSLGHVWERVKAALWDEPQESERITPCAAIYYNPTRAEWLVEPADVMQGRAAIHNYEARITIPESESVRLPAAAREAMASCSLLDTGPVPAHPGWTRLVREHHLLYVSRQDGEIVVEPWARQHAGGGGSYAPLVEREIRIPEDATDDSLLAAVRAGLQRARSEEEAW